MTAHSREKSAKKVFVNLPADAAAVHEVDDSLVVNEHALQVPHAGIGSRGTVA